MGFCNEYKFDEKDIFETVSAWHKHRFTEPKAKKIYIALCLFVTAVLLFLAFDTINLFTICFSVILSTFVVGLYVILLYKTATKKSAKAQVERMKVLYKDETSVTKVSLTGTEIQYLAPGVEKIIQYSDILKVIQSNNFIILLLNGGMTLPLKKDSFTKGTVNECLCYLDDMMK